MFNVLMFNCPAKVFKVGIWKKARYFPSVGTVPCACPYVPFAHGQAQGTVPTGYQIPKTLVLTPLHEFAT